MLQLVLELVKLRPANATSSARAAYGVQNSASASAIVSAWLPPAPGTASATYSDTSSSSLRKSQPLPVNELIQMIATKFDNFDPAREEIKRKGQRCQAGRKCALQR